MTTNPTDKLRAYLAAGQRLEERVAPAPWHIGHVDENSDGADIDSLNGQAIAHVYTRPEQSFICDARTRVAVYRQVVEELVRALTGNGRLGICSVENTLALMTEGEGSDPEVYREMARSALVKLREALDRAASLVPGESKL